MRKRTLIAIGALALVPAVAGAWGHEPGPPPGEDIVSVPQLGGFRLWPFTGSDFSGDKYDPVNLLFPDLDPREIRQALLGLEGERGWLNGLPFAGCSWADAMGSEQVAWAETDGWVGGEVQLVCIDPAAPLGDPFRTHLRLYREADVTLGAAHFEFLIPNTAQHEVLSWDFAQLFVVNDMVRAGLTPTGAALLQTEPDQEFRAVRRAIYDPLLAYLESIGAEGLLAGLGLYPPPASGDVPIPLLGVATILSGDLPFDPAQERIRTRVDVPYDIVVPRPFCADGPLDYVHLAGTLRLTLDVHTNRSGKYERRHRISGTLYVTPIGSTGLSGPTAPAIIREEHHALLTDQYGQLTEMGLQALLGDTPESLWWRLDGGHRDRYRVRESCSP